MKETMNILWPMIAILALTGPAFAGTTIAEIERQAWVRLATGRPFQSCDRNHNGKCDPEERAGFLDKMPADLDLNGNGQVELEDLLATCHFCLEGNRDEQGRPIVIQYVPLAIARLTARYDQDGDGQLSAFEWCRIIDQEPLERRIFQVNRSYDLNHDGRLDPEESRRMRTDLLTTEDRNGNGFLEPEELRQRLVRDLALNGLFYQTEFDHNGNGGLDPEEKLDLLAAFKPELDRDQDGTISDDEIVGLALRVALLDESETTRNLNFSREALPWFSITREALEKQDQTLLPKFDRNHNGQLDDDKLYMACLEQLPPGALFHDHPLLQNTIDLLALRKRQFLLPGIAGAQPPRWPKSQALGPFRKDNADRIEIVWFDDKLDANLDAGEQVAIHRYFLPRYDLNHNGRLDHSEWMAILKDYAWLGSTAMCRNARLPEIEAQRQAMYLVFDTDGDGHLDTEEAILVEEVVWQAGFHKVDACDADRDGGFLVNDVVALVHSWEKRYERDGDGHLNLKELQDACRTEKAIVAGALETLQHLWNQDSKATRLSTVEWNIYLEDLMVHFDSNHDGRIDQDEMELARCYYRAEEAMFLWFPMGSEIVFESSFVRKPPLPLPQPLGDFWKKYPGEPANASKGIGLARDPHKAGILRDLLERYDANHNGQLDVDELLYAGRMRATCDALLPAYPQADQRGDGFMTSKTEWPMVEKLVLAAGDNDHNGRLDNTERRQLLRNKAKAVADGRRAIAERQFQQEHNLMLQTHKQEWLKKYDFNGNGKLDPEERTRAEAEAKAGIQAPARDE
jgi:Ca2+-binding EF-hand superfamily protein